MINLVLALLVKYSRLTSDEAAKIAEELNHAITPHRYEDAERLIDNIVEDLEK